MGILSNIRLWLGFGPADIIDDPLYADTAVDMSGSASTEQKKEIVASANGNSLEFDPAMQEAIFAKVVDVFNRSLPHFLSESVDANAQRKYLRECLDQGIADYLKSLNNAAAAYCEQQWKSRQSDMNAELDAIRLRAEDVERQSNEIHQKQLSADRQKRALTEKVHELESQLARVISENEQLQLENRSLMSRLKVAAVNQDEVDKTNAELQSVKAELLKLRNDPSAISHEREEALNQELEKKNEAIESLKERIRLGDEMCSQLRNSLKDSQEALADRDKKNTALEKKISDLNIEIKSLNNTIAENIKRQVEREQALREEIEMAQRSAVTASAEINFSDDVMIVDDAAPRISEDDISAMEEEFASADWDNESVSEPDEAIYALEETETTPKVEKEAPREPKSDAAPLKESRKPKDTSKNKKPEQLSLF